MKKFEINARDCMLELFSLCVNLSEQKTSFKLKGGPVYAFNVLNPLVVHLLLRRGIAERFTKGGLVFFELDASVFE